MRVSRDFWRGVRWAVLIELVAIGLAWLLFIWWNLS